MRIIALLIVTALALAAGTATADAPKQGSVIFIHPDGSSYSGWLALRLLKYGPDGRSNWDRLEALATYSGHMNNSLVSTSHGGATAHAWGVKPSRDNYGSNPAQPLQSRSGKPYGIMVEAQKVGMAVGIVNSGHIGEPGTGVFLSSVAARAMTDEISIQIVESGAEVIMSGGEVLLLPEGVTGRHGQPGRRKDGRNLIAEAGALGYTVVYTKEEMLALTDVDRVLGVFAAGHTFNATTEEKLRERGLPLYTESSPTVAEMELAALDILGRTGKQFLLVVEEEGTDNFGNSNNATGTLEALSRADDAIGVALEYIERHPATMLITAADSDAGGIAVHPVSGTGEESSTLPPTARNGAPLDGIDGTGSAPFEAQPDQFGNRMYFGVSWAGNADVAGGVVARAHGLNAALLPTHVDNTGIYRMMYATLFGVWLETEE